MGFCMTVSFPASRATRDFAPPPGARTIRTTFVGAARK